MQSAILQLRPEDAQVLRIIRDKGVVRGYELLREAKPLADDDILSAVRLLVKNELISLDGGLSNVDQIAKSYLNVRPSARGVADFALRSAL